MSTYSTDLRREIGLWGLSSNLINIMIGAGIFVLPAIVASGLGPASVIAYLFCGILITLVMLCFAEVGSKIISSGGVYAYIENSFGDYFGFNAAILFILSSISADAAIANAIADVAGSTLPVVERTEIRILFFLLLFSGLAYINVKGVKEGVGLVKFITIAKLAPLTLLVLLSWNNVSFSNLVWDGVPSIGEIGEVSLILFFAFQGSESGLSVSGEVRNPQKIIPRALLVSISSVLLIYILIQTIAQGVLGPSLSSYQENPLGEVANIVFGPVGFALMTIGAVLSMFGNVSSAALSIPRVLYGAAKDSVLPVKSLARVHKKHTTPFVAIVVYATLCFLMASIGGFKQLAILSSASILLIYFGVSLAVIKLRHSSGEYLSNVTFRIPGGYIVPIISALVILWFLSNLSRNELLGIISFIVFLTVFYHLLKMARR